MTPINDEPFFKAEDFKDERPGLGYRIGPELSAIRANKKTARLQERVKKLEEALESIEQNKGLTILGPAENEFCNDLTAAHALGANKAFGQCSEVARKALEEK